MRARKAMIAAVMAALVLLVGCGGGDDTTTGSNADGDAESGAVTDSGSSAGQDSGSSGSDGQAGDDEALETSDLRKAAYLKKVNVACGKEGLRASREVNEFAEGVLAEEELAEPVLLARIVKEVLVPSYEAEIAMIRKMGAPTGDEKKIESMLAAQEAAVEKAATVETVKLPEDFEKYFTKVSDELEAYGFNSCVHG